MKAKKTKVKRMTAWALCYSDGLCAHIHLNGLSYTLYTRREEAISDLKTLVLSGGHSIKCVTITWKE